MSKKLIALLLAISTMLLGVAALPIASAEDGQPTMGPGPWQGMGGAGPATFMVPLSGDQVRPEPVDTNATGAAVFWADENLTQICYAIALTGLEPTQAQVRWIQEEGSETGEVVLTLYPKEDAELISHEGVMNGTLVIGSFTQEELEGPLAGQSMISLLSAAQTGNVYVQVNSEQHPQGELRGDLAPRLDSMMMLQGLMGMGPRQNASTAHEWPLSIAAIITDGEMDERFGLAVLWPEKGGQEMSYMVLLSNVTNVTRVAIMSDDTALAELYPGAYINAQVMGEKEGFLAVGNLSSQDLQGDLAGMSPDALIQRVESGEVRIVVTAEEGPDLSSRLQVIRNACPDLVELVRNGSA